MECTKEFLLTDESHPISNGQSQHHNSTLKIVIHEIVDPSYGMYVWPCAPVLAQYVWHNKSDVKGKKVLEIGAGTALPGIVAAKCGASLVMLSDGEQLSHCLKLCQRNLHANCCLQSSNVKVIGLTWGTFSPQLFELGDVDIILGSDCFYDPKEFEGILVTISWILDRNPQAKFWCTYQERSADWSIEYLLLKWSLQCEHIPLNSFDADSPNVAGSELPGSHSIHMLHIFR